MKKWLLIFSLLATTIIYSMDRELRQALSALDFKKIEKFCLQSAIEFNKNYDIYIENVTKRPMRPLEFAIFINNIELAQLLCQYGDKPSNNDFKEICYRGKYKFLRLFHKYCPEPPTCFYEGCEPICLGNLLHLAVDAWDKSTEFIAAIALLYGRDYYRKLLKEKKSLRDRVDPNFYLTPLEYALKRGNRKSAKKAAEIFQNENLLNTTIVQVNHEFMIENIKTVGMDSYLQGRELGINLHEMQEQQKFFKRKIELLENTNQEE